MALNGSKAKEIFFSLPSSFNTVPTNTHNPCSGTRLYSLSFCCVDVIADKTDSLAVRMKVPSAPHRLTRLLMFEAVPYSAVNMFAAWEI